MAKFKTSDFRHRAQFQCKTEVEDDYGVLIPTWEAFTTVGARIVQLSMRDVVAAGIKSSTEVLRLTVPLTKGTHRITHTDRVCVRGNTYDIHLVDNFDFNTTYISFVVRRSEGD